MPLVLALQQRSPPQWVPLQTRGWRLLGTPPLSGGAGGPAGIPQSGRAAQRTPNLPPRVLPKRAWLPVALGCPPKRGVAFPPTPGRKTESPRPYTHGSVCPPADAVAARKCLHGDDRSRAQGWKNTSGSGWWGEGPSGEGAPGMGGGEVSSPFTTEREAFKPRPFGSEGLVAMRGSAGVWHPGGHGTGCVTPWGAGIAGDLCHTRVMAKPCVVSPSPRAEAPFLSPQHRAPVSAQG